MMNNNDKNLRKSGVYKTINKANRIMFHLVYYMEKNEDKVDTLGIRGWEELKLYNYAN